MKQLDLFAGIGGFSLAAHWFGIQTTQFVEIDPYCQQVLNRNFSGVPIYADITDYHPRLGEFDIITFGSPCQDFSSANSNGRGLEGERSGLFFKAIRIVRTVRPRFAIFENVPNVLNRGFHRILWAFADIGIYDIEWQIISASSVGAPHLRKRLFLIAYPNGAGLEGTKPTEYTGLLTRSCSTSPYTQSQRSPWHNSNQAGTNQASLLGNTFWQQNPHPEPAICRVDAGLPKGVATRQLKALGNTVVPQCAAIAYQRIMEIQNQCQF